jgi:hypothetical protein
MRTPSMAGYRLSRRVSGQGPWLLLLVESCDSGADWLFWALDSVRVQEQVTECQFPWVVFAMLPSRCDMFIFGRDKGVYP